MTTTSTTLNLLTREGAICVTFTPALEAGQYDQLLHVTSHGGDQEDISRVLVTMAHSWGCMVSVESAGTKKKCSAQEESSYGLAGAIPAATFRN